MKSPGPLDRSHLTLELVDRIYAAAIDPPAWQLFVRDLSRVLGGSPTSVWVRLPGQSAPAEYYREGVDARLQPIMLEHFERGLPWRANRRTHGFESLDDSLSSEEVAQTGFYRDWMRPQGFAPVSPLVCTFAPHDDLPLVGVAIYQLEGKSFFGPMDLAFLDGLAPHLERAFRIDDHLRALRRGQDVLAEVIDRLPTGIMLLDATGAVVACNRSANVTLESGRGLRVRDGRPMTDDADENGELQRLIRRAIDPESSPSTDPSNALRVSREPGDGQLPLLVSPLLAPTLDRQGVGAVAAIFFGDPALFSANAAVDILRALYGLTHAEADLAHLLTEGLSLEEAAKRRRVTLNTTRSQLKHVFAKTGARRQSDLVRIVLSGIATLRAS